MNKKLSLIFILAIFLISFLTYFNTIFNSFTHDDKFIVSENKIFQNQKNLTFLFSNDYFNISQEVSYRPVITLTYFVDYKLFGINPIPYHIENIILHSIVCILCYLLFLEFFKNPIISFISTLLFIVHPINSEVVNSIGYREDALSALFFLISTLCFIKIFQLVETRYIVSLQDRTNCSKNQNPQSNHLNLIALLLITNLSFLFGLFSKENCVMLPVIMFLYVVIFYFNRRDTIYRVSTRIIPSIFLILIFYFIIRFSVIKFAGEERLNYIGGSIVTSLITTSVIIMRYFLLIIFPLRLSIDYPINPISSLLNPIFLFSFLVIIFVFFLICKSLNRNRTASFFLLWFFITLIPTMNIIPILNPMAERYLYLPLIGLCGLVGSLLLQTENVVNAEMCLETGTHNVRSLQKRKGKQKYFVSFLLIISVLFMLRTFIRNSDWKDDITLAKKTIQTTPNSMKSHYNLGYYYLKANVLSQAEEEFKKAIEIDKNYAPAYNNLGLIYKELGNNDKALQYYLKTLEIDKNYIHTQFNLGNLYQEIGEYDKAILYYQNALQLDKKYFGANVNLGNVYLKLGDYDKAIEYYKKALEIEPENTDVKENFKIAEDLKRNTKP